MNSKIKLNIQKKKKMNLKTDNFIINSEKRKVTDNKRDINNNYNNNRTFINKKNDDINKLNEDLRKKIKKILI